MNQITLLVQRLVYHIASLWYRVQKMKENDGQGVSIVVLTHGESKYLSEWVVYYLKVLSVDQLIIIDNNSTPDSSIPVLIESFPDQIVTHWEPMPIRSVLNQVALLNKYTSMYKQSFSWIGCIDSDEFVVLPKGYPSLTSFLDSKGAYADSIYLGWKMVGPADSSCFAKTGSLVLSSFHTANDDFPPHQLGKSFVRTGAFGRFLFGPHQPILRGGGSSETISYALYHYYFRDESFFEQKIKRRQESFNYHDERSVFHRNLAFCSVQHLDPLSVFSLAEFSRQWPKFKNLNL